MMSTTKATGYPSNNFNLLRLIFASCVVFSHAPVLIDGDPKREPLFLLFQTLTLGEVAVDGFFLLSGYLIVKSWLSDPSVGAFLYKRILRIFPGFVVASLLCAFVVGPLGAADPVQYFRTFPAVQYLKSLLFLRIPVVPSVFEGSAYPSVNGSMWTIFFEFCCYLIVLAFGFIGGLKNRAIWGGLTCAAVLILALRGFNVILPGGLNFSNQMFRFVAVFSVGGCFYLFRDKVVFNKAAAFASAIVLCASMFDIRIAELALVLAGSYLLFYFALARIPALATLNRLPDVSYGLYLYAWPVKKLLIWYVPGISLPVLLLISLPTSAALGLVSWKIVEAPFLKLKGARTSLLLKRAGT